MNPFSVSRRLSFVVLFVLLLVAALGSGHASQAAPQVLVNVKLSGPMPSGGQVVSELFAVSPDAQKVLYLATQASATQTGLFTTFDDKPLPPPQRSIFMPAITGAN